MTKKQTQFWFLFSSLILFGFLFTTSANAENYLQSTPSPTSTVSGTAGTAFLLGQDTASSSIVWNGEWYWINTDPASCTGGTSYINIYEYNDSAYSSLVRSITLNTLGASPNNFIAGAMQADFNISGGLDLGVGKYFALNITCNGTTGIGVDAAAGGSFIGNSIVEIGFENYTGAPQFCLGGSEADVDACAAGGGGGGSPPTISFFFPTNGTTTGQFTNWVVQIGNVSSTPPYIYGVAWASTGTPNLANPANDGILQPNSNVIQFIPSSIIGTPFASTTYKAIAFIALPGYGVIASSSEISFTLDGNAPLVANFTAHNIPPLATSTAFCIAPANTLNIGEGISFGFCSIAATFFGNSQPGYQFLGNQWSAFQQVPPFNLIFGVASSVQDAINQGTTTQQNLSIGLPIGLNTPTVSVLSSSTLKQLFVTSGNGHNITACDETCAEGKLSTILGWLSNIIYAGTAITTIAMIL